MISHRIKQVFFCRKKKKKNLHVAFSAFSFPPHPRYVTFTVRILQVETSSSSPVVEMNFL